MSESNWRDLLSPRCLYVYSNDTETIRSEELVRAVDGVVQAISVPDPADQRGGNRLLVLLNNEENKKHLENQGIIYQGRHLNVESSNNTCDIPNEWERFVDGAFQQLMQYPSGQQSAQENDVYANMPSVQNIPMPNLQHYMGQQMAATPGQQNPMNPGHIPFMHPFYMQGMPPNMYPQEGAVGQNVPPEAGNFPNPQQLWLQMQHMQQMFYQMHGGMPGTEGSTAAQPPPYTPAEEKSSSLPESLESTATKSKQSYSDLQSSDGESVTPSAPDEEIQEDEESIPETSKSEAAMIKVTNIPDGTSKDALLFFFENRRKSGGGSVEDLEYDPDTKSAVITFEEPEAVKRIIGRLPILFNGVQIEVKEFKADDPPEEVGEVSESILEVLGVPSIISQCDVMKYFENTRQSGGGEIKSMEAGDGVFYIRFEDEHAIENVLKKQHKIDGTAIEVCRYIPPPPPKPVPMYPDKVFVTNISEKTTKISLENFLEAKTKITPASIEYGKLEGTALVTFEEDIDFEKLQLVCKRRTLDKSHLEISRVPVTNCVIVKNIAVATSRDTLEFYFDNEKRSGVSGVLDVKMLDGFCLVYFDEAEAVDVVCRRPHRIFEQDLDVKIYYECLGQVESDVLHKSDVSDLSMSQHCVECQTCGCYSEFYCNACHQRMCGKCRDEHLTHPDNTQHEVCRYEDRKLTIPSVPCKLHPRQQLTLCCENCQQAICALCTTKGHAGHVFLDLEEVYTKKYKTRIEHIRKIRDDILPTSRLRLQESRNASLEIKVNLEILKSSMKEQASQIKGLVDAILTENLQDLHSYETSAIEKLENQETVFDTYVTQMQAMLEEYQNSMPSENPVDFLSELNDTLNVKFEPIPEVLKISPGNFSHGTLNKEEIRKQFGVLTKPTN